MNIVETIIDRKLSSHENSLRTYTDHFGGNHETLNLGVSRTELSREILPDGSRGELRITTNESDDLFAGGITGKNYVLHEGQIIINPNMTGGQIWPVERFRVLTTLAKIALGRVRRY
jgi:hypothetical protein